jgi:hypothetical protein
MPPTTLVGRLPERSPGGWIKNATGEYSLALLISGIGLAVSGLIALAMRQEVAHERPAAGAPSGQLIADQLS